METAQEFWRPIINDFQPVGPVRPEAVRRFFVDRKEHDPQRSRVQRLKLSFLNSRNQVNPYKALLTGHVGSGKSSELIRLGEALASDFFVVQFDAELTLSPETANHFDVLLGMGLAVHKAAQMAELNPSDQLANNLVKSLAKFVRKYENRKGFSLKLDSLLKQVVTTAFVAGVGALGGPLAAGAAAGAFEAIRLELNVRDELVKTLELPANRQEVIGALNKMIEWVRRETGRPVLIITDGLDKIPAGRARLLFADSSLLRDPACALIYAAPVTFYHRVTAWQATNLFDDYKMLPNPPVHKRPPTGENWQAERIPNEDGLKVMRQVVAKRLTARNHALDEVITPAALDLLARMSGGVMREMIRLFRDAATGAQSLDKMQIDETIAQDAVDERQLELGPQLDLDHRRALRLVLEQGALSGGAREPVEDDLLQSLHLLSYQDEKRFWFDAYPNALPLLA